MLARKRGGQPGNSNAVKHGRFTAAARAARLERIASLNAQRRASEAAWAAQALQVDYGQIIDQLRKLRG